MYIDTHCHLQFPDFNQDRSMVIGNAKKAGVKKMIIPAVNLDSSKRAIELSCDNPGSLYASVGFHPYEAQKHCDLYSLQRLISIYNTRQTNRVIAIGECGLDYHLYKGEKAEGKKDKQKRLLEEHGLLALKYNLPLILHCRDAFDDIFQVLDNLPSLPKGVLHCFSGGLQDIRAAIKRSLYIGIDGNLTYSKHLQTVIKQIPLSSLLLETDSPYLAPIPHRGTRNQPKFIPLIAAAIARFTHQSIDDIKTQTTKNARALFSL